MGELRQHQPILGNALHPRTDVGDKRTRRPQAKVEASERAKGARHWIYVRDDVLPPWNWPKCRAAWRLMSSAPRPNAKIWLAALGSEAPQGATSRYPTTPW